MLSSKYFTLELVADPARGEALIDNRDLGDISDILFTREKSMIVNIKSICQISRLTGPCLPSYSNILILILILIFVLTWEGAESVEAVAVKSRA